MALVTTPLKLWVAGLRLAGYTLENNIRVAQELARAAVVFSPFGIGSCATADEPIDKPKTAAPKAAKPKAGSETPAKKAAERKTTSAPRATPKSISRKAPLTSDAQPTGAVVQLEQAFQARKAAERGAGGADGPKRPRAPSKPPAMPERMSKVKTGSDPKSS
jgi:hypothetical protein